MCSITQFHPSDVDLQPTILPLAQMTAASDEKITHPSPPAHSTISMVSLAENSMNKRPTKV